MVLIEITFETPEDHIHIDDMFGNYTRFSSYDVFDRYFSMFSDMPQRDDGKRIVRLTWFNYDNDGS